MFAVADKNMACTQYKKLRVIPLGIHLFMYLLQKLAEVLIMSYSTRFLFIDPEYLISINI